MEAHIDDGLWTAWYGLAGFYAYFPAGRFVWDWLSVMLTKILEKIRNTNGVISIRQLSQELDVEPTALEGMILQLTRMGKLEMLEDVPAEGTASCKACIGCHGAANCPLVVKLPRSFRLKLK